MMLLDNLKEDLLTARKNGDTVAKGCLNPLISDCDAIGKDNHRYPTDDEVLAMIKSYIKRLNIALDSYKSETQGSKVLIKELEILESYLPKQLGELEIKMIIAECNNEGMTNIGQIMKHFKSEYNGCYDASIVSKLVKEGIK